MTSTFIIIIWMIIIIIIRATLIFNSFFPLRALAHKIHITLNARIICIKDEKKYFIL